MVSRRQDPEPIVEIHSGNQEESTDFFRFFDFLYLIVKIVLYSMIVMSHWLTFVANYVILSKINVTNKVGQFRTIRPLVLKREFYLR